MRAGTLVILLVLGTLAAAVAGTGTVAPDPAFAGHASKNCGIVAKGASDWRVKARSVKCRRARSGIRLYLRNGGELRGFNCSRTSGLIYCGKGSGNFTGQRL